MKSVAIAPLFKGDAPAPSGPDERALRQRHELVITGRDPVTGKAVEDERYLEALCDTQSSCRQLAENVGRVVAGNLQAMLCMEEGVVPHRIFVEGCTWDWGMQERRGAQLSKELSVTHAVGVRSVGELVLPASEVLCVSRRTREEFCAVLEKADRNLDDEVLAITHEYHAGRSAAIGRHVSANTGDIPVRVSTPLAVADTLILARKHALQPREQFLVDVIEESQPAFGTSFAERVKEFGILRPLNAVYQFTGWDVERLILSMMKGRGRV